MYPGSPRLRHRYTCLRPHKQLRDLVGLPAEPGSHVGMTIVMQAEILHCLIHAGHGGRLSGAVCFSRLEV